MFDAFFVACCALGVIALGAWFSLHAKRQSKLALECSEDIPRDTPIWDYIKGDHDKLQISDAFHGAVLFGVNGLIAILMFSSFVSGLILPIVLGAALLVPIEVLYSKKVSVRSYKILRVVVY